MFYKSCWSNVFAVTIFAFIICSKKVIITTHLLKKLIYETQNYMHQLTTHMSMLIMCHNRFSEKKMRQWRHIYHNIDISRPTHQDIEFPRPKSGRYFMYCYGIYYGDSNSSSIYILSSMFYVLDNILGYINHFILFIL